MTRKACECTLTFLLLLLLIIIVILQKIIVTSAIQFRDSLIVIIYFHHLHLGNLLHDSLICFGSGGRQSRVGGEGDEGV